MLTFFGVTCILCCVFCTKKSYSVMDFDDTGEMRGDRFIMRGDRFSLSTDCDRFILSIDCDRFIVSIDSMIVTIGSMIVKTLARADR